MGLHQHLSPASRAVAAIRLWPHLPTDDPELEACAALVVYCLKLGLAWAHPQLLIQAAQALSVPVLKANMCALVRCHHAWNT